MAQQEKLLTVQAAAGQRIEEVFRALETEAKGLTAAEASGRLAQWGPNSIRSHHANAWSVLARQLKNPILLLLFVTAGVSLFFGDVGNSIVIGVILLLSVGLGFYNDYRAERAAEDLHSRVSHRATVLRDGAACDIDVVNIVVGDVVRVGLGAVVPADLRLITATNLQCDESILTGESLPSEKDPAAVAATDLAEQTSCLFMGTVVQAGTGEGVVIATGTRTVFGDIAVGLGTRQPETDFQRGLRRFSFFLLQVALGLTTLVFVANLLLQRPLLDSLLFSLAIAIGMTPQLLPAVVSTGLAAGSSRLARKRVLVKRLAAIEDLGDMNVLVTDKTGTLTEGHIDFVRAVSFSVGTPGGLSEAEIIRLGMLASEADYAHSGNQQAGLSVLDAALWSSLDAQKLLPLAATRLGLIPFDHDRRRTTVLVRDSPGDGVIISKGAPEDVFTVCTDLTPGQRAAVDEQFSFGARVIAVATRHVSPQTQMLYPVDEAGLTLQGILVFHDPPKLSAKKSLARLAALGVTVKIATGDNHLVAEKVFADLGLTATGTLLGRDIDALDDDALTAAAEESNIFARVSPEQKARIIRLLRKDGRAVGFLGDGVNDALALHAADVGISVHTAVDVAKDAADVVLLDKDLDVLATGVNEGRRIFANTMKYVLMGTSGDFGNMFSAAIGSVVLNFLPMLPGQILLNDLLYDSSQLAIPGDNVDPEQLHRPSHWNIQFIRRFMFAFGPLSSIFDFATFALMLFVFHAGESEFQAGWFMESLATETLIIFAVRTRRVPFFKSRPSAGLTAAVFGIVAIGCYLPYSPLAGVLGFSPVPAPFFLALVGMTVLYLLIVETLKKRFFRRKIPVVQPRHRGRATRVARRASRFSVGAPVKWLEPTNAQK
ncbi:magnesium-translocating P-type ATPase [Alpinimonas psychrophila]|uniref:Magnesium-transporting ATPase, P-type 1 n=1 Tax=Alpinimonas psychrophila TaxID=748908 RepID=A0A7W3JTN8_9MICO|nr:Mg2+-importing ATPase [Alpinimonas psychrophila]